MDPNFLVGSIASNGTGMGNANRRCVMDEILKGNLNRVCIHLSRLAPDVLLPFYPYI